MSDSRYIYLIYKLLLHCHFHFITSNTNRGGAVLVCQIPLLPSLHGTGTCILHA